MKATILCVDKYRAALFAVQSYYPDPVTDPQEIYFAHGNADEPVNLARPVIGRIGKAEALELIAKLRAIVDNEMVIREVMK